MAGQYRFKDSNGNIVAQISASVGGAIAFSGSVVDFTQANNVILGNVQLAGTASNALLLDGFDSQAFAFTSSIHPFTASIAGTNTFTASIAGTNTFTSSTSARLNSIETITSSNVSRLNSIETITASNVARLNSLEIRTGSLATTGSNTFIGTQTITGSLFISADLVVQGSSSLQNITASAVSIGTNIVNLNTANPAIRYAGLVIGDSGSIGSSGSFFYDSVQDEMIFIHRGANTIVTSSVTLMGPQTYDSVGNETYPTLNRIQKGTGNEHLVDSCIFEAGGCVGINTTSISSTYGTLTISGTGLSIADDGNAKLQIGRFSSTACNAYIKMGANACSLRITNNTDLADLMVIDKGGSVCIGGTMNVSSIYLTCTVDAKICSGTNIGLNIDGSALYLNRYSCSNIVMVPNGGNVGICNTNPLSPLSFANSISDKIDFYNDGLTRYTAQINSGELRFYTTATNDVISLYAGNTVGLVNKNGSIGIGHASPVDRMDVMGALRIRCNTPNFTSVCNSLVIDFVPTPVFGSNPMARYYAIGCTGVSAGHIFTVGQPTSPFNALTIFGDGKVGVNTDNCATGTVGNGLILRSSSSNVGQTVMVIQDYRRCNKWAINGQTGANDATLTIYSTPNNTNDYTPVFSITQNGQIQRPCSAAFHATINTSTNIGIGGRVIQFNCVLYNAGGAYDGTTSTFTAPVSGLYQFNFVFLNQNTQNVTGGHSYLSTNFGVGTYYFQRYGNNSALCSTGYGGYVPMHGSVAVYLPSGHKACVAAFWDADGAFTHNSTAWASFSGYLVG